MSVPGHSLALHPAGHGHVRASRARAVTHPRRSARRRRPGRVALAGMACARMPLPRSRWGGRGWGASGDQLPARDHRKILKRCSNRFVYPQLSTIGLDKFFSALIRRSANLLTGSNFLIGIRYCHKIRLPSSKTHFYCPIMVKLGEVIKTLRKTFIFGSALTRKECFVGLILCRYAATGRGHVIPFIRMPQLSL